MKLNFPGVIVELNFPGAPVELNFPGAPESPSSGDCVKAVTRRLLEEHTAVVVVPESGEKSDVKWHVPHPFPDSD